VRVAHYVICRPGMEGARERLAKAGIEATIYPAIVPVEGSCEAAMAPLARFNGERIPRRVADHGALLSHMGALGAGMVEMGMGGARDGVGAGTGSARGARGLGGGGHGGWVGQGKGGDGAGKGRRAGQGAGGTGSGRVGIGQGAERVGIWEDDVAAGEGAGWRELQLPLDCGVVYLGGILWRDAREYGEPLGNGLWRLTKPMAISCTHAVLIHRSAAVDVMNSYATMAMAVDDLLSVACARALASGSWSTCFVQPWLAWQVDRRETWPSELLCATSVSC
jgi:hypothetical protein